MSKEDISRNDSVAFYTYIGYSVYKNELTPAITSVSGNVRDSGKFFDYDLSYFHL